MKSLAHRAECSGWRNAQRARSRCQAVSAPQSTGSAVAAKAVTYAHGCYEAQGLREEMEDRLMLYNDPARGCIYGGVYDGHGGHAAAEWLKNELHLVIANCMDENAVSAQPAPLAQVLSNSFVVADKKLLSYLEEQGGEALASAGSTCTVALLQQDRLWVANVGDSQAFLLRRGQPLPITTPHRVYGSGAQVKSEMERVKGVGGWIYDGRVCNILAVSRAFGDWEFKGVGLGRLLSGGVERGYWKQAFAEQQNFTGDPVIVTPDVSETLIKEEDELVVVSTDGLWDVVPPNEVMRWARKQLVTGMAPAEVAESLVNLAIKRKTTDNVACVVIDLKGPEFWATEKGKGAGKSLFGGLFGKQ